MSNGTLRRHILYSYHNHGLVADKILAASEALASCTLLPKQLQGKPIDIQVFLSSDNGAC